MNTQNRGSNPIVSKVKLPDYCPTVKAKMIITPEFKSQIDYLHAKVKSSTEWSGMLFYTILEGDLQNFSKLVIRPDDIFLMDIGSAAHTAATIQGDDLMKMYETIPDAENKKYGLIHSHHNMDTFFSGTDVDELNENVHNHNFYVSLIVNYAGKYCAKVAWVAELKSSLSFNDIDDRPVSQDTNQKVIVKVDFDIVFEKKEMAVPDYISDRFLEIEQKSKAKIAPSYSFPSYIPGSYPGSTVHGGSPQGGFRESPNSRFRQDAFNDDDDYSGFATEEFSSQRWEEEWNRQHSYSTQRVEEKKKKIGDREWRDFICAWLSECTDIVKYTPGEEPFNSNFGTIREALKHYESVFKSNGAGMSKKAEYNYFLQMAQKKLAEVSDKQVIDHKPSYIGDRVAGMLREWVTEIPIASDFVELASSYPEYVRELRKIQVK